ncbi:hypothetical protein [Streptomyces sp. NPDC006368]|uniref:hypothetical protein n=1 Tax=Streptomyces sp. NPDC006368 TaxID=3156760 RepID=UPI0033A60180
MDKDLTGRTAPYDSVPPEPVPQGDPVPQGEPVRVEPVASADPVARAGHMPQTGEPAPQGDLMARSERDELGRRMHEALADFVDSPQRAVREAADVLEAAADHLTAALAERRRSLRTGWDGDGSHETHGRRKEAGEGRGPDTEQLRVTLRAYREMTERLLRM